MALKDDLQAEVNQIFADQWTQRVGTVVPSDENLSLGNNSVELEAVVLYADLSDSTKLVDGYPSYFAAEVYKAFLRCAARIIRSENGSITAYDGDRVMAVYVGGERNTQAVRTGLKINWACKNIIQPALNNRYAGRIAYTIHHTVGIDGSSLRVARAGIRGANDLVWIGRAANWAAKLCTLSHDTPTWITKKVYEDMLEPGRTTNGQNMWKPFTWNTMNGAQIYASTWWWSL